MYLVQGIHPTTPGTRAILCASPDRAAAEAKELTVSIGGDIVGRMLRDDPFNDPETEAEWNLAKANDWEAALAWLKTIAEDQEFDVWIDEMQPVDVEPEALAEIGSPPPYMREFVTSPETAAKITGNGPGATPAGRIPILGPDDNIELLPHQSAALDGIDPAAAISLQPGAGKVGEARAAIESGEMLVPKRERDLHEALGLALGHVEHMAGFIGRLKAGYSFESLGEDFSQMRQALDALPIGRHIARRVEQLGAKLAEDEPLPVALAMIDQIINIGGEQATLARAGKKALAQMVYAGTELHASLGEAVERHVYDFDNGDVIEPGCTFTAAMRRWSDVMRGDPMVYATPSSPLPWRAVISDKRAYLTDAHDAGTGIIIENPTPSEKRNLLALLDAVNAQASIAMTPEVAVIIEGGVVQTIVGRNKGEPITVHIVDYDVDRGAEGEGIGQIPQTGGGEEPAKVSTYHPNNIEQAIEGGPFWQALREVRGA